MSTSNLRRRTGLLLFLAAAAGCLPIRPRAYEPASLVSRPLPGLPVTVRSMPADRDLDPLLADAVRWGLARAGRWGHLRRPVTLVVLPSHRALERAAGRPGYSWLRAWAFEEEILLQSPRSWPWYSRGRVRGLLAHELTHVVHYQTAGLRVRRGGAAVRRYDPD